MLEYDKVTALLAAAALTEGARAKALCLVPSGDEATVLRRQQVTADARRLIDAKGYPSFGGVRDVSGALARAGRGAMLQPLERPRGCRSSAREPRAA